jgi:hypothetical protein
MRKLLPVITVLAIAAPVFLSACTTPGGPQPVVTAASPADADALIFVKGIT